MARKFDQDAKDCVVRLVEDHILAGNHRNQGKCLGTKPRALQSATMSFVMP